MIWFISITWNPVLCCSGHRIWSHLGALCKALGWCVELAKLQSVLCTRLAKHAHRLVQFYWIHIKLSYTELEHCSVKVSTVQSDWRSLCGFSGGALSHHLLPDYFCLRYQGFNFSMHSRCPVPKAWFFPVFVSYLTKIGSDSWTQYVAINFAPMWNNRYVVEGPHVEQ